MNLATLKKIAHALVSGLTSLAIVSSLILAPKLALAGDPTALSPDYLAQMLDIIGDDLETLTDDGISHVTVDVQSQGNEIVINLVQGNSPVPVQFRINTEKRLNVSVPMAIRAIYTGRTQPLLLDRIELSENWFNFNRAFSRSLTTYEALPAPKISFESWLQTQEEPRKQISAISKLIADFIGRSVAQAKMNEFDFKILDKVHDKFRKTARWHDWERRITKLVFAISATALWTPILAIAFESHRAYLTPEDSLSILVGGVGTFALLANWLPVIVFNANDTNAKQLRDYWARIVSNLKPHIATAIAQSKLRKKILNSKQSAMSFDSIQLKLQVGQITDFEVDSRVVPVVFSKTLPSSQQERIQSEYQIIREFVMNALREAQQQGSKSLAVSLLAGGVVVPLPLGLNLRAILEAVRDFNSDSRNSTPLAVTVVLPEHFKSQDIEPLTKIAKDAERNGIESRESMMTPVQRATLTCSAIFSK